MTEKSLRIDSEYEQPDSAAAIPPSERVAELMFAGLSSEQAIIAVYGGSEPAVGGEQADRIRIARAELAAVQQQLEEEAA